MKLGISIQSPRGSRSWQTRFARYGFGSEVTESPWPVSGLAMPTNKRPNRRTCGEGQHYSAQEPHVCQLLLEVQHIPSLFLNRSGGGGGGVLMHALPERSLWGKGCAGLSKDGVAPSRKQSKSDRCNKFYFLFHISISEKSHMLHVCSSCAIFQRTKGVQEGSVFRAC